MPANVSLYKKTNWGNYALSASERHSLGRDQSNYGESYHTDAPTARSMHGPNATGDISKSIHVAERGHYRTGGQQARNDAEYAGVSNDSTGLLSPMTTANSTFDNDPPYRATFYGYETGWWAGLTTNMTNATYSNGTPECLDSAGNLDGWAEPSWTGGTNHSDNTYGANTNTSYTRGGSNTSMRIPNRGGHHGDFGSGYGWVGGGGSTLSHVLRPNIHYLLSDSGEANHIIEARAGQVFTVRMWAAHFHDLCTKCSSSISLREVLSASNAASDEDWADNTVLPRFHQPDNVDHLNSPQTGSNAHDGLPTYKLHKEYGVRNNSTTSKKYIWYRKQRPRAQIFVMAQHSEHKYTFSNWLHGVPSGSSAHGYSSCQIPNGGQWIGAERGGGYNVSSGHILEEHEGTTLAYCKRTLDEPGVWYELSMTFKIDPQAHWVRYLNIRVDNAYPDTDWDGQRPPWAESFIDGIGILDMNGWPGADVNMTHGQIGMLIDKDLDGVLTRGSNNYNGDAGQSFYQDESDSPSDTGALNSTYTGDPTSAWPEPDNDFLMRGFATNKQHLGTKFMSSDGPAFYVDDMGIWKNEVSLARYSKARWDGGTWACGHDQYYRLTDYGTGFGVGTIYNLDLDCTGFAISGSSGKLDAYIDCYVNIDHLTWKPARFEVTCGINNQEGFIVTIDEDTDVNAWHTSKVPDNISGNNGEWRVGENHVRVYIGDADYWQSGSATYVDTYEDSYAFNRVELYRADNGDWNSGVYEGDGWNYFVTIRDFAIVDNASTTFTDNSGSGISLGSLG